MKEEKGNRKEWGKEKHGRKIKPTKLWKRKNNEMKIKIGKETNKYTLNEKNH
jgi:hypothetical protein